MKITSEQIVRKYLAARIEGRKTGITKDDYNVALLCLFAKNFPEKMRFLEYVDEFIEMGAQIGSLREKDGD